MVSNARLVGLILLAVVCVTLSAWVFAYSSAVTESDSMTIGAASAVCVWVGYTLIAKDILSR
jgi:hypothetical protein